MVTARPCREDEDLGLVGQAAEVVGRVPRGGQGSWTGVWQPMPPSSAQITTCPDHGSIGY